MITSKLFTRIITVASALLLPVIASTSMANAEESILAALSKQDTIFLAYMELEKRDLEFVTLSSAETKEALKSLPEYLTTIIESQSGFSKKAASEVLSRLKEGEYIIQYGAYRREGLTSIIFNAGPRGFFSRSDDGSTAANKLISVDGGGSSFWQATFDLKSKKFSSFQSNARY